MKIGTSDITKGYMGSSEVKKIYLGSTIIFNPTPPTPTGIPNDEIWYTTTDNTAFGGSFVYDYDLGASVISNTYVDGKGIIKCDGNITKYSIEKYLTRSKLTSLTLPSTVTYINGSRMEFNNYIPLTLYAPTSPTLDGYSYIKVSKLYVPAESVEAYRNNIYWRYSISEQNIQAIPT